VGQDPAGLEEPGLGAGPDGEMTDGEMTDGGDSLACVADGRCYGIQGVGPSEEESAR
jgi:hypothetical protein